MEPILCAVGTRLAFQKEVDPSLLFWTISGIVHNHPDAKEWTTGDLQKITPYIHKKVIACSDCASYRRFFNWWSSSNSAFGIRGENN